MQSITKNSSRIEYSMIVYETSTIHTGDNEIHNHRLFDYNKYRIVSHH